MTWALMLDNRQINVVHCSSFEKGSIELDTDSR